MFEVVALPESASRSHSPDTAFLPAPVLPLPIPPASRAVTARRALPLATEALKHNKMCGATGLRMVLTAFGKHYNQQYIEHLTSHSKLIGSSPLNIKKAAEAAGLKASIRNFCSAQTVASVIDSGGYIMAIANEKSKLGYIVINGYRKTAGGKIDFLIPDEDGSQKFITQQAFDRNWAYPTFCGIDTGFRRCVIAFGKEKVICERISGNAARNSVLHAHLAQGAKICGDLFTTAAWFTKAVSSRLG